MHPLNKLYTKLNLIIKKLCIDINQIFTSIQLKISSVYQGSKWK